MPPQGHHGPHGYGGFDIGSFINPYTRGSYRPPAGGRVNVTGEGITGKVAVFYRSFITAKNYSIKRNGPVKGSIVTARVLTSGKLRHSGFLLSIKKFDKEIEKIKKKYAGSSEAEQVQMNKEIKAVLFRKLDAAQNYYSYLLNIGFIDEFDYDYYMKQMADKMKIGYNSRFAHEEPAKTK